MSRAPAPVDVREEYNMDVDVIEPAITPGKKGIMRVHLHGRVCFAKGA